MIHPMQSPHDVLGISADASPADIKAVYRNLVKANHPGRAEDKARANDILKQINAAYSALTSSSPTAERARASARASARPAYDQGFGQQHRASRAPFGKRYRDDDMGAGHAENGQARNGATQKDSTASSEDAPRENASAQAAERPTRYQRQQRANEQPRDDSASRAQQAQDEALRRRAEDAYARGKSMGDTLQGADTSGFGRRGQFELFTSSAQDAALDSTLTTARRRAARNKVAGDGNTVAFHKAQKITFEDRTMKIHLGSRAEVGHNAIAIPAFHQVGDNVRIGKEARLMSLDLGGSGRQTLSMKDASKLVKGANNMRVQFVFSDEPENLRDKARTQQADAR